MPDAWRRRTRLWRGAGRSRLSAGRSTRRVPDREGDRWRPPSHPLRSTCAARPLSAHRRQQRAQGWTIGARGRRNGWMESPERVELPAAFEDVDVDILVQLIGPSSVSSSPHFYRSPSPNSPADMMERLMAHNDQIPLLPCVDTCRSPRDLLPMIAARTAKASLASTPVPLLPSPS